VNALPAYDELGSGDAVVLLLHGIGGGRSIWGERGSRTLQALAAAGWRAVALDLPGYGGSGALGPPTMASMAGAVAALVAALAPRRVAIVGHSMGGMVAQEVVATRPALPVHALVLACTSPAFGRPEGDWQAKFVAERLAPLDAGIGMAGMARKLVPAMVGPQADDAARAQAVEVMSRVPEATYRAALHAIAGFDRRAALPAIDVPTLCLAGEHDATAPPKVMQGMAARIPGAQYRCLAGAGHIANVEQPAAFNAALVDFLRQHDFGS